ncbi:MAG: hypothetical protein E7568_00040 [Ruminococcaceae bacterium]|nr:hypothetical protein [Oscillospiraceae bacterium]
MADLCLLFIYDFKQGILNRLKKFVPLAVFVTIICAHLFVLYKNYIFVNDIILSEITFADFLIYVLKGMEIYNPNDSSFVPDLTWLLLYTYLFYLVSGYIQEDLQSIGKQILLKCKSRIIWWLSKTFWCINLVIAFYICIVVSVFIFSVFINSRISFICNSDIHMIFSEMVFNNINLKKLLLDFLFIPMLTAVCLSVMQISVSLIWGQIVGFVLNVVVLILSIFVDTDYLIGNMLMPLRQIEGSLSLNNIGFVFLMIVLLSIVSTVYFHKKDIY